MFPVLQTQQRFGVGEVPIKYPMRALDMGRGFVVFVLYGLKRFPSLVSFAEGARDDNAI